MIKEYKLDILQFLIFLSLMMIFVIAQSSPIMRSLSFDSPPQLWVIFIAYFSVYKPQSLALLMIYLTSFFYATLTSMSFGKLLLLSILIFALSWAGKPLNLKNLKIFFIFCTAFTAFLPLVDWTLSSLTPLQPAKHYSLLGWTLTIINTALCVILIKPLMFHLDRWVDSLRLPFEKRFLK